MPNETSPTIKEKAPLILAEIKKAKSILLHCHPLPDPDSIGSALAMKFALEQMGKKATVIKGDSEFPQAFMHFPGASAIVQRNFFEVDLKDFDLFIIVDCGSLEMVSSKKKVEFPESLRTIVIDHHVSNNGFGNINLIDTTSAATTFVLFQLFKEWEIEITQPIAMNLLIGMYTDTGGFKYIPTDYRTLEAAAECAKIAPYFNKEIFVMENSETKESVYFKALALNSIKIDCGGNLAMAIVSYDDLKENNIPDEAIRGDEISNILKSVVEWNITVSIVERQPNIIKLSFRTRDKEKFDVSRIAVALGGGGHRAAAGACLRMPLQKVKDIVVSKVKELYNL